MSAPTANPYAVLGVGRNATQQQIASAYRRLAKRYHPDVQPDGLPPDRMRRLNEAWEILSSPVERARYDADHAARGPVAGHWSVPRRQASVSQPPPVWSGAWTAPPPATRAAYAPPHYTPYDTTDDRLWPRIVVSSLLLPVAVLALFVGLLPFPLFGLALFVLVRALIGRFEDRS
jgi:curved DNA-binding protein CbpA